MTAKRNRILAILAVVGGLALGAALFSSAPSANATPSQITAQSTAAASSTFPGGLATTTLSYMSAGNATSTYQIDANGQFSTTKPLPTMAQVDAGSILIVFNASSSASILNYQFQYSNNSVDWYPETQQQTLGSTGLATSSPVTHSYTPLALVGPAAGTSTMIAAIPNLQAYHERVVFSIPIGSPNGAVYAEVVTKRNPSNP